MLPLQSILIFTLLITTTKSSTFSDDIAALHAFKSSIKPTSIPPTSCLGTWNFSTDPCSVPRVTHFTCGLTCSNNRVIQITLDSQGYTGTLTPLISKLTQLIHLDISDNNFYGPIPDSLSSLTSLKTLILRVNSFSGQIPPSISNLPSLETLDLSHNQISGSIPNLNSLESLTRLDLSYNKLNNKIPKLPKNLNELAIKANSLSGTLLNSDFNTLTSLTVVELSDNFLTGTVNSWFFLLPSLQQIDLANNTFDKIVVAAKPNNAELVAIDLSYNKIGGYLPANLGDFPSIRSIALSYNKFRGPIPLEYSRKGSSLQRLLLEGNYLNGSPPEGFISGAAGVSGSLGDNCLQSCPASSQLCLKSQKPVSICQQAYGGKPKY